MATTRRLIAAAALALCTSAWAQQAITYPKAETYFVDYYHGTPVADPYRWLEDPDSAQTRAWIDAQNKITMPYLAAIPQRDSIQARVTELWNYEKFSAPGKEGGKYFYSYNSGLQNQGVLYVTDKLEDKGRVLLDPNTLKADGTAALAGTAVSDDGKYIAYGIAEAGSDWNVWKVRDIATGRTLATSCAGSSSPARAG
jgi:prolyl oligopeptidase